MIIRNMVKCNDCGKIIESTYRHDFVVCDCWDNEGGGVAVDGGKDYLKRCGYPESYTEMSETSEDGDDNERWED